MQANYPQNNPAGGNNYTVVHYCNTHIEEKKSDSVVLREENDLRRWLVSLMFFLSRILYETGCR